MISIFRARTLSLMLSIGCLLIVTAFVAGRLSTVQASHINDLLIHWTLNESTGTIAADISGHDSTGTWMNGPVATSIFAGQIDRGLEFDGVDDYVAAGDVGKATEAVTVSAWVRPGSFADPAGIVSKDDEVSNRQYALKLPGGTNEIQFLVSTDGSAVQTVDSSASLITGVWYHVVGVYEEGNRFEIYIDGNLSGSASATGSLYDGTADLNAGSTTAGSGHFFGALDDIRIYDTALSAISISNLFNAGESALCDNDFLDLGEVCDGDKLNDVTCRDLNFASGNLTCNETCDGYNTSQCIPDTLPPTVSMSAPDSGDIVSNSATLAANAFDIVGVAGVVFLVNGQAVGVEDTDTPFEIIWDTTGHTNGSYTVAARARDGAGNEATSAAITVEVENIVVAPPPTPDPDDDDGEEEPGTDEPTDTPQDGVDECGASQGNTGITLDQSRAFITEEQSLAGAVNTTLVDRLLGRILLQVERNGEAWYLDPVSEQRYYLANGASAYQALRTFGLGITNADLSTIPIGIEERFPDCDSDQDGLADKTEEGLGTDPNDSDTDGDGTTDGDEVINGTSPLGSDAVRVNQSLVQSLKGRIVLQVEDRGQAWYIHPVDGKRYYMKNGTAAYQIMRFLSLGITNADLQTIGVGGLIEDIAPE